MRLTVNIFNPESEQDTLLTLEVFPDWNVGTLRESIHAESGVSPSSQQIYHDGRIMSDDSKTMEELQIGDGEMLAVHVRNARPAARPPQQQAQASQQSSRQPQQGGRQDPEFIRLQILGNPALRQQVQQQNPDLAAALDDPARFGQILQSSYDREQRERIERQREIERLNDDPFDIENQRKIEEMIRQEAVMENLQNAMEHNPEVFGRVHLLYINVEVNGHRIKALVDSGAQATIMSPECSDTCGISRLIDKRFAGVARGVGTAKIIGRVHSAQIKLGNLFLPSSFTVMEGKSVDLLLGLDMLKRYQATIDLAKGSLIIQGEDIPFLGEADIPKEEEAVLEEPTVPGPSGTQIGSRSGAVVAAPEASQPQQASQPTPAPAPVFTSAPTSTQAPSGNPSNPPGITPAHIDSLVAMGADRAHAIQALQAAEDNVEVAAGLIFFAQ